MCKGEIRNGIVQIRGLARDVCKWEENKYSKGTHEGNKEKWNEEQLGQARSSAWRLSMNSNESADYILITDRPYRCN